MWLIGTWLFPVISACMWLGMLLGLFINWELKGHPHYPSMEAGQKIAYISDTGAYHLKPLFIAGSVITTVFLDLAFLSERWLRHTGRLVPNTSRAQKILSVFAIIFAIAGSAGLILLSIFDTYRHPHLHDGFLLLFIGGFIISAIFLCAEYQRLGIHYRNHRILRISFWVKLFFILVEIVLAIVFAATSWGGQKNVAAVFEWVVAIIFTVYVLSFLLDLLPSVKTSRHVPQGFKEGPRIEKGHEHDFEKNVTNDSTGPNRNANTNGNGDGGYSADDLNGGYRGTAAYPTGQTNGVGVGGLQAQKGLSKDDATVDGFGKKKEPGRLHF